MTSRQESEIEIPRARAELRKGAIPKFKQRVNWENLPDYDKLPDWALIDKAEVCILTNMSSSVIDRRVAGGEFRQPIRHGKNYLWQVGYVRDWLKALNSPSQDCQ